MATAAEIDAGKAMEKTVLDALPGYTRYYQTYENGGKIVVIDVVVVPQTKATRKGRAIMGMVVQHVAAEGEPYVSIGDVALRRLESEATGTGRLIGGTIDDLVFISAAGSADDDTTRRLLQGIDVNALQKMAADSRAEAADLAAASGTDAPGTSGGCAQRGAGKFCTVGD